MIINELGYAVTLTLNLKIDKIEYFENCQTLYRSSSLNVQIWYNKSQVLSQKDAARRGGVGRGHFHIFVQN